MKLSKNFIIGSSFVISIALLYFGINFLKGSNIFKKQQSYIALFDDITGLNTSSPVYVSGYQIGLVNDIKMHSENPVKLAVEISLRGNYKIPKGSYFQFSSDFLGVSVVKLIVPENAPAGIYVPGDTIPGKQAGDMLASVAGVMPKTDSLLTHIDKAVLSLNELLSSPLWLNSAEGINSTITQLNAGSKDLSALMQSLRKDIPAVTGNLANVSADLREISSEVNSMELEKTFASLEQTIDNLKTITGKINEQDNSLGKLTNSTELHDSLTNTLNTATKLLEDIRLNPEKYLSIRLRLF